VRWLVVFKREYQGLSAEVVHEHLLLLYPSATRVHADESAVARSAVCPVSFLKAPKTAPKLRP
jgi:hypothetical protein